MAGTTPTPQTLTTQLSAEPAPIPPLTQDKELNQFLFNLMNYIRRLMNKFTGTIIEQTIINEVGSNTFSGLPTPPDTTTDWSLIWDADQSPAKAVWVTGGNYGTPADRLVEYALLFDPQKDPEITFTQEPVPANPPFPAVWTHDDGDAIGPPIVARSVTTHVDGLVSSYTVSAVITYSATNLFIAGTGTFVWNGTSNTYGDSNEWMNHSGSLRWEYTSAGLGSSCFLYPPNDQAHSPIPGDTPCLSAWTIVIYNGVTGAAIYYKDWGRSPKGVYKLGWYDSAGSKSDWGANGTLPATLVVT